MNCSFIIICFVVVFCFSHSDAAGSSFNDSTSTEYNDIAAVQAEMKKDSKAFVCLMAAKTIPILNESYFSYFDDIIQEFEDNDTKIHFEVHFYQDGCSQVYTASMQQCINSYKSKRKHDMIPGLIVGPFCPLGYYEKAMREVELELNHGNISLENILIMTSSVTMLSSGVSDDYLDQDPSHEHFHETHSPNLIYLNGHAYRVSVALLDMLQGHFKWRHVALVTISRTESLTRFCSTLFESMQRRASSKKTKFHTKLYTWTSPDDDWEEEEFVHMFETLANVIRVIVVCSNDNDTLRFIKEVETKRNKVKYGLIVFTRNIDTFPFFIERMRDVNILGALQYLKFICPKAVACSGYDDELGKRLRNKELDIPLGARDDVATTNTKLSSTVCALRQYLEIVKNLQYDNQSVGKEFIETYEPLQKKMRREDGRIVEYLPILILYTYVEETNKMEPGVEVNWWWVDAKDNIFGDKEEDEPSPLFTPRHNVTWYGEDRLASTLKCKNVSGFFPCPAAPVVALTIEQKVAIGFGIAVAFFVSVICFYLPIQYLMHHNRRFLLHRWRLLATQLNFTKKHSPSSVGQRKRVLIGKFGGEERIIAYLKADRSTTPRLDATPILRDVDNLAYLANSNEKFAKVIGFNVNEQSCFYLVFHLGFGTNLKRMLKNVKLSSGLRYSLVRDLAVALEDLHNSFLVCHGDLRSNRCIVDERCVCRLVLTRIPTFVDANKEKEKAQKKIERHSELLWTAPELLHNSVASPTAHSDVYSFAIIVHEITFQRGPFFVKDLQGVKHGKALLPKAEGGGFEINVGSTSEASHLSEDESCAERIISKVVSHNLRPSLPFVNKIPKYQLLEEIMESCWQKTPTKRMRMKDVVHKLLAYMKEENIDVAYKVAKRLMMLSRNMIKVLNQKKMEEIKERDRSLKYLTHMMPPRFSYEFATGSNPSGIEPEYSESVTIYFNDLVEFSMINKTSIEVINVLDELFQEYDKIVKLYDVMPLHRVGSSLLLASGVPYRNDMHASEIAQPALQIRQFVKSYKKVELRMKAGIHSGSVMSGIVGKNIPQFGLFGDTVNTASRMTSTGKVGEIQLSEDTYKHLTKGEKEFEISGGSKKKVKGKGEMRTYWLKGFHGYTSDTMPTKTRLDKHVTHQLSSSSEDEVSRRHSKRQEKSKKMNFTMRKATKATTTNYATRDADSVLSDSSEEIDAFAEDTKKLAIGKASSKSVVSKMMSAKSNAI